MASFGQFFLESHQFFEVLQTPKSEGPLASENIKEPRQRLWESMEFCIGKNPGTERLLESQNFKNSELTVGKIIKQQSNTSLQWII